MCAASLPSDAAIPLHIVYPWPDAHFAPLRSLFAFGSTAPGAHVWVDGVPAMVAPDGAWIAYVPVQAGTFSLRVIARFADSESEADRAVTVDPDVTAPFPATTTVVQLGETVTLAVGAPAGASVTANGAGLRDVALHLDAASGSNTFAAAIVTRNTAPAAPVVYRIVERSGTVDQETSSATLAVAPVGVLYYGYVIAYSPDPDSGYRPYGMFARAPYADTEFTLPVGTPVAVTAKSGNYVRASLGAGGDWWIDRREVQAVPAPVAQAVVSPPRLVKRESARWTTYSIDLSARQPFRIFEHPDTATLTLTLFGASAAATHSFTLGTGRRPLWGYRTLWSGNTLVVAVRKPPIFLATPLPALDGLLVVIDPGHSPDTGAIGPLGTLERDINLDIALRLRSRLQSLGARVVMTRTGSESVKLYDRPALAERIGADLLVSVHNNAPPDGVDPRDDHGYSVYYFYPHSSALAQSVYDAYGRDADLPDLGLHSGDLALVRSSELPSVLTESAFITWPWEEMKLRDPAFQDRLAATIADGLERFAESARKDSLGI
jgi:N-acetylmuramoyl-L-alanine amidase